MAGTDSPACRGSRSHYRYHVTSKQPFQTKIQSGKHEAIEVEDLLVLMDRNDAILLRSPWPERVPSSGTTHLLRSKESTLCHFCHDYATTRRSFAVRSRPFFARYSPCSSLSWAIVFSEKITVLVSNGDVTTKSFLLNEL